MIVFEDDISFEMDSTSRLAELVEDVDASSFVWDFIYLGRKQMSKDGNSWVAGMITHHFLIAKFFP